MAHVTWHAARGIRARLGLVALKGKPYPLKQKLSVVMAAEMVGVTAAAEAAGVPHRTVGYWLEQPEFAEYRRKAREDLAEEVGVVAHLAWQRVAEALRAGKLEPRDALFAADKATTLLQLVTGQATNRSEVRDVTMGMDDHEWDALTSMLREAANAGG